MALRTARRGARAGRGRALWVGMYPRLHPSVRPSLLQQAAGRSKSVAVHQQGQLGAGRLVHQGFQLSSPIRHVV